jgi:hypothetical protein
MLQILLHLLYLLLLILHSAHTSSSSSSSSHRRIRSSRERLVEVGGFRSGLSRMMELLLLLLLSEGHVVGRG